MTTRRLLLLAAFLPVLFGPGPCGVEREETLTAEEAAEALDEATLSTQAMALTSSSVEIATNFTIGQAVEAAAEELRRFIESQLPCAAITIERARLTVDYGALPGDCVYRGHVFSGQHTITVVSAASAGLVVDHAWTDFTNGLVSVTGAARVTWSLDEGLQRRVEHELTWTRNADGRQGVGSGDRTQTLLDGGLAEGIRIDGVRDWSAGSRAWHLDITAVQVRWDDPVPQSGSYALLTPSGKTLTMSFAREDEDTIAVTLRSGGVELTYHVSKLGTASS